MLIFEYVDFVFLETDLLWVDSYKVEARNWRLSGYFYTYLSGSERDDKRYFFERSKIVWKFELELLSTNTGFKNCQKNRILKNIALKNDNLKTKQF